VTSLPYIAGELARALVPFLMGIVTCSAQFCCSMFLAGLIRLQRPTADCKPQPPGQ
jgi:hypothetical protein